MPLPGRWGARPDAQPLSLRHSGPGAARYKGRLGLAIPADSLLYTARPLRRARHSVARCDVPYRGPPEPVTSEILAVPRRISELSVVKYTQSSPSATIVAIPCKGTGLVVISRTGRSAPRPASARRTRMMILRSRSTRALTGTANGGRHKAMPLPWLRQCLSPCWATLPSSSLKGQLLFCQSVPPLPIGALRGTSGAVPARYAYPGLASSRKLPVQILGARRGGGQSTTGSVLSSLLIATVAMATVATTCLVMNEAKLLPEQLSRLYHWRLAHPGDEVPIKMTENLNDPAQMNVKVRLNEDCKECDKAKFQKGGHHAIDPSIFTDEHSA